MSSVSGTGFELQRFPGGCRSIGGGNGTVRLLRRSRPSYRWLARQWGRLYIVRYLRPRYAIAGKGVVIAALPPRPIDKGNAGTSMLAHVITQKYLYHMPLDRQRAKHAPAGRMAS